MRELDKLEEAMVKIEVEIANMGVVNVSRYR